MADRLDTLVGIFGIGQPPTGSKDPFALRRASLAILRILIEKDLDLDLAEWLSLAGQVLDYMIERFRAWYEEAHIPTEVFRAVSARKPSRPLDIERRVRAVHAFSQLPEATALAAANKRVSNILSKLEADHPFGEVSTNLLIEPREKTLWQELARLAEQSEEHLQRDEYTEALAVLAGLRDPVDAFFDDVMVNAEDADLRHNRLNLLKALRDLFLQVADISQLAVGK